MEMTQWILVGLGVLTGASNIIAFMTRQQMQINKLETNNSLAQMEIRLSEKIGAGYVNWQAHNDLVARMDRMQSRSGDRD